MRAPVSLSPRLQAMMDDADLTPSTWSRIVETIGLRYTTTGFDGSSAELIPGGSTVPVMWDGREEYHHLLKAYRQTECSVQVAAIARGLATQVPRHLLSLFTWQRGRQTVDLELHKRCTACMASGCPPPTLSSATFGRRCRAFPRRSV